MTRILLVALLVAATLANLALANPSNDGVESAEQHNRVNLFDFAKYKQMFKKSYANLLEEAVRVKYFTSRAMRAFASALSFKFRRETYYLAVNHMSDRSPAELDLMENYHLLDGISEMSESRASTPSVANEPGVLADSGDLPEFVPDADEDLQGELRELLKAHRGELGYGELEQVLLTGTGENKLEGENSSGTRRVAGDIDVVSTARNLPLSKLINTGEDAELPPETQAKIVTHVPSDNPHYRGIELQTRGLVDQQLPVEWHRIPVPGATNPIEQLGRFLGGVGHNLKRTFNAEYAKEQDELRRKLEAEELAKPDEVYVDLRDTNCFFLARNQGPCGSCYAFAAISVMEYLRCRQTGKLVAMSEQYMVDCGGEFVRDIFGCKGGVPLAVPQFVRNFGLHLRDQYPYHAREEQCPYEKNTDPKYTGYLRADDFSHSVEVPIELWPEALKHGPLLVAIATGQPFREFGGGIYSGKHCPAKATHAVLVVGHGRQDHREYWLVRNSHGTGWGEHGYMRLDKKSNCIHPAVGFAFGVRDPKLFGEVQFAENELHKPESLMSKLPHSQQIKLQFRNQARGFGS